MISKFLKPALLTGFIFLGIIVTTVFGTIKIMDHRERVLLDNEIIEKIGLENFGELDHIDTKIVTHTTYYSKDGAIIIETKETSEKTANYNN